MRKSFAIALVVLLMVFATAAASAATLEVDNHTGFFITIIVDGVNVGTVDPFDVATVTIPYGENILRGFADGTTNTWGPVDIYDNGYYTWNLWP